MTARPTEAGDAPRAAPTRLARHRGVALLIVLVAVAVLSLATLVPLRAEQQAMRRERERELLFIGDQFRRAIASYAAATPPGAAPYPAELADLLEDKRSPKPRRHLRRVYLDPFTGAADWTLLRDQGGIVGVASRSPLEPLQRSGFAVADAAFAAATSYAGWAFAVHLGAKALATDTVPALPATPPGAVPSPDAAPPVPAPDANPVQDARRECARVYFAALGACVLDQATSAACRSAARDSYRVCLGS